MHSQSPVLTLTPRTRPNTNADRDSDSDSDSDSLSDSEQRAQRAERGPARLCASPDFLGKGWPMAGSGVFEVGA